MSTEPRIYVVSLADSNNGVLHGVWIDANQDAETIQDEVNAMLRESKYPNVLVECPTCNGDGEDPGFPTMHPAQLAATLLLGGDPNQCPTCHGLKNVPSAEGWAIRDCEGFYGIRLDESESFETVSTLARLIKDYGEAFAAWWDNGSGGDVDSLEEDFQEAYQGTFRSLKEWAEEFIDNTAEIPEPLRPYVDYAGWARNAVLGGVIWTVETAEGVAIFR